MRIVRDDVDIDLGAGKPSLRSVAVLGVPLGMMCLVLIPTVSLSFWLSALSTKVDTVIKHQDESRTETYALKDATRDLALRDDRISELGRRIELLEKYRR